MAQLRWHLSSSVFTHPAVFLVVQIEFMHKDRWRKMLSVSTCPYTLTFPPSFFPSRFPFLPRFSPLPLFLHMISPESYSSGCTSRPTKLINMLYMIDPSACLVYTVCAPLRQEALTFHTQGSSPSLSRIIVQLMSRSQPITWEGFAHYSRGTHSDLREWGWQGEDGMFSSSVHIHILSPPLAEGFFIKGTRCGRQQWFVM